MVKNSPAKQETQVLSLGWEDPLDKEWQPTPIFLPGESHGRRSLVDYSPWGRKESDTTDQATSYAIIGNTFLRKSKITKWTINNPLYNSLCLMDCFWKDA